MKPRNAQQSVIILKNILQAVLIDELGQYKLTNGTVIPSIQIRIGAYYTNNTTNIVNTPIYKMIDNTGVECAIEASPETDYNLTKFNATNLVRYYTVYLEQHNANKTLSNSLELIYSTPDIRPFEQPQHMPRIMLPNQQGEAFERAILKIPESARLNSL